MSCKCFALKKLTLTILPTSGTTPTTLWNHYCTGWNHFSNCDGAGVTLRFTLFCTCPYIVTRFLELRSTLKEPSTWPPPAHMLKREFALSGPPGRYAAKSSEFSLHFSHRSWNISDLACALVTVYSFFVPRIYFYLTSADVHNEIVINTKTPSLYFDSFCIHLQPSHVRISKFERDWQNDALPFPSISLR